MPVFDNLQRTRRYKELRADKKKKTNENFEK